MMLNILRISFGLVFLFMAFVNLPGILNHEYILLRRSFDWWVEYKVIPFAVWSFLSWLFLFKLKK